MVSRKENSALAQQLMAEATARYRIDAGQLTIHQDRGAPMTANRYIDLLSDMGVVLSHSRPRVSNDNAFSEAQFKTQKYQPDYPGRFEHGAHARTWCETYFDWYNFEHHHAGLATHRSKLHTGASLPGAICSRESEGRFATITRRDQSGHPRTAGCRRQRPGQFPYVAKSRSPGAIGRSLPTNSAPWINAIPLTRSDLFAGIRRPLRHHHAS